MARAVAAGALEAAARAAGGTAARLGDTDRALARVALRVGFGRIAASGYQEQRHRFSGCLGESRASVDGRWYKATVRPSPTCAAACARIRFAAAWACHTPCTCCICSLAFRPSARAGNRRFSPLSARRAHTKSPYKTDLHRKTLRALNSPRAARTVSEAGLLLPEAVLAESALLPERRAEGRLRLQWEIVSTSPMCLVGRCFTP